MIPYVQEMLSTLSLLCELKKNTWANSINHIVAKYLNIYLCVRYFSGLYVSNYLLSLRENPTGGRKVRKN